MSTPTTIRVPSDTRDALKGIAETMGLTMQEVISQLVADTENKIFFKKMELAYKEISADPDTAKTEQDLIDDWDSAVNDGLDQGVTEGVTHAGSA